MDRDRHRQLTDFHKKALREQKEMNMVRNLKQEVNAGANGTQDYVIKKGINSGKIADKGQ
jgi:hypothetical protein|tara:strand:+ start:31 stop:210 length:180 start_codon:yes stop_codon:yes gene_type:complete